MTSLLIVDSEFFIEGNYLESAGLELGIRTFLLQIHRPVRGGSLILLLLFCQVWTQERFWVLETRESDGHDVVHRWRGFSWVILSHPVLEMLHRLQPSWFASSHGLLSILDTVGRPDVATHQRPRTGIRLWVGAPVMSTCRFSYSKTLEFVYQPIMPHFLESIVNIHE